MNKKLFILIAAFVILFGGEVALSIAGVNNDSLFNDNVVALCAADEVKNYSNAKNYKYDNGEICCKGALLRTCTVGYFCSGDTQNDKIQ